MPVRHIRALKDLCKELTAVAKRHFEAYVRATSAHSDIDGFRHANITPRNCHIEKMKPKLSYAQAVNNKTNTTFQNSQLNNNSFSAKGNRKLNSDDRLFVDDMACCCVVCFKFKEGCLKFTQHS